MKPHAVGQKYKKQLMRADPGKYVRRHVDRGHVGKEPEGRLPPDPQSMTGQKAERHRLSVDERIDELYKLALAGSKLAITKPEPDIRGLAACIAQGIAATALMGKATDGPHAEQKDSAFWKNYFSEAGNTFGDKKA